MTARILVVEDELHLARGIADNLLAEGHAVDIAGDGEEALQRWQPGRYALVVLDVMLPRRDGYAVCRHIRAAGDGVPILFLSAKNSNDERVEGLQAGGDDYVGKPFDLRELLLRVDNMLRRGRRPAQAPAPLRLGPTRVDFARQVTIDADGHSQPLSGREAQLLHTLSQHAPHTVGRAALREAVWGAEVMPATRTLDALVQNLRRRLEPDPQAPRYLLTVPGEGYRLAESVPRQEAP